MPYRTYDCIKSEYKKEDYIYTSRDILLTNKKQVDLTDNFPQVLDQGYLGSCVSNCMSNALKYLLKKTKQKYFQPSRLYIYYNARVLLMGLSPDQDTGISIKNCCSAVKKYYACNEKIWKYNIKNFNLKPSIEAYENARIIDEIRYYRIDNNLNSIRLALSSGLPILYGFLAYESFESDDLAKTGIMKYPDIEKEKALGGHCVLIVGYDDDTRTVKCQNTWGTQWGNNGYFTVSYRIIQNENISWDFYIISEYK